MTLERYVHHGTAMAFDGQSDECCTIVASSAPDKQIQAHLKLKPAIADLMERTSVDSHLPTPDWSELLPMASKAKPDFASGTEYLDEINRAASLLGAGHLEEVERLCLSLLQAKPDDYNALQLLGLVRLEQRNAIEAIPYFDQALRVHPDAYQVLNSRGNALQLLERYSDAIEDYDKALSCKSDYAPALANRGNALQRLKRYAEAIECYDRALAAKPDYVEALNNRGNALQALMRYGDARDSYDAALAITPKHSEALYNRGNALQALGCYDEAIESYDMALVARPDYPAALSNRGNALQALHRHAEALESYECALALKPDYVEALSNRGTALAALKRHEEALQNYDRALSVDPRHLDALTNRALTLVALKRYSEAVAGYDAALALHSDLLRALFGRGTALQAMERHGEAIESYDRALLLKPDLVEALHNRGFALHALTGYSDAVKWYDQALSLKPEYADALNNRGRALQALGRHDDAMDSYDEALALQPDHADAQLNKGLLLLLLGELDAGWALYEARWKASEAPPERHFAKPLWLGESDISRSRLLLHAEQGLGDTIQLCRYAKLLSAAGVEVAMEVQAELATLLRNVEGVSKVVARGEDLPDYDFHCPLLSLPLACKTTLTTIPAETPYLKAEASRLAKWSTKLGAPQSFRVGVAWSGGTLHRNDVNRSIPLSTFSRLLSLRVDWICLQNHIRDADRAELAKLPALRRFEPDIEDFSDTAALLELCDLVICVDTAVAHLAGALAKPLWLLLPFAPDWRWMLEREDSPWYATARLFRQPAIGDWDIVLQSIERELEARLEQARPS